MGAHRSIVHALDKTRQRIFQGPSWLLEIIGEAAQKDSRPARL